MKQLRELKDLKNKFTTLEKKIEDLSNKVDSTTGSSHVTQPQIPTQEQVVEIMRELQEKVKRINNLCVFNMPASENDEHYFKQLCADQMGIQPNEVSISETKRVGNSTENRPKLLIVKLANFQCKQKILQNAPKLRNFTPVNSTLKVYISPDQTKKQCEFQKILRDELKARRANGEDVVISKNKIVNRTRPQAVGE